MNHAWPKGWSETLTNINQATVFWEMGPEDQDYFLRFPHDCKPPFPHRNEQRIALRDLLIIPA